MGDEIIMEKLANHYRNRFLTDGGKLILTKKELLFNPHKINLPRGKIHINICDIKSITKRSRFLISKQVLITKKNGESECFVMWNRDELKCFTETETKRPFDF